MLAPLASILLADCLHDDLKAREVLKSLVRGYFRNRLFSSEMIADHGICVSDRGPRETLFHHMLSGLCVIRRNDPGCNALSLSPPTHVQVWVG